MAQVDQITIQKEVVEVATPPTLYEINRTINLLIKDLKQHVDIASLRISELKQLKQLNPNNLNDSDNGTNIEDNTIVDLLM